MTRELDIVLGITWCFAGLDCFGEVSAYLTRKKMAFTCKSSDTESVFFRLSGLGGQ